MIFSQRGTVLTAPDAAAITADFGMAVAVSSTGLVMIVGDSEVSVAGAGRGAVYTFDWSGSAWVQRGSRINGVNNYDYFGRAVAVSADGSVMAVGAYGYNAFAGAVYIFDWSGSAWVQRGAVLLASDTTAGDTFGFSVALDGTGTRLLVGAPYWEGGFSDQGAVYLYVWTTVWTEVYSWAFEGSSGAWFGYSVAMSEDALQIVIGAMGIDFAYTNQGRLHTLSMTAPPGGWSLSSIGDMIYSPAPAAYGNFGARLALSAAGTKLLVLATEGLYEAIRTAPNVFDTPVLQTFSPVVPISGIALSGSAAIMVLGDSGYTDVYDSQGGVRVYDITLSVTTVTEDVTDAAAAATSTVSNNWGSVLATSMSCVSTIAGLTYTLYAEAIGLTTSITAGANTTASLVDNATITSVVQQALNQLIADSANGTNAFSLGAALTLVDIAEAVATQASTYNSVVLVAELIASLEAYNGADGYDVTESGALSDAYVQRLQAITEILEQRHIDGFDTIEVHTFQLVTDTAATVDVGTYAGSLIGALLSDGAVATISLYIGGEVFTGWVLNTDTLAPSEYQFVDRQFNSACKHGDRYLLAADDGIYEFTDDTGVETVMTYIKTGKTDFGSDLKKRVVNSYMVYAASGDMVLKVTTSEFGNLVTRNYRVVAQANDTTDTRRVDIGKGIKSRYWQFELVGDGVDCDIDEIGMLPVVLSRRI